MQVGMIVVKVSVGDVKVYDVSKLLESDAALPLSGKCHMVLASFC